MKITQTQIQIFEEYIDEAEVYLSASQQTNNVKYMLKAINDEIKTSGVDWQYELNERGKILQKLYEEIYEQNEVE